ncbi:MAG TPA: hypothetical protein VGN63_13590 [Flavisolibacter sp.]|jgi:hypothetical protein|nr:hypothetical protein [Flavisolibacter sp.]
MKPTLLIGCALLAGTAVHAQFSLLPYAGFEQSNNSLRYGSGYSASDVNGNLKAGLRADYRLKGGHSPFFNLTTSPAPVSFRFDRAGSLLNAADAVRGNLQLRLEAGYLYNSKPIQLGKKRGAIPPAAETVTFTSTRKSSCGSYTSRSRCGTTTKTVRKVSENKTLNMRLQPALALAYIPSSEQRIKPNTNGFDYTVGTWRTALVPSMGFAFAKGSQSLFTLTAFYTRALGQKEELALTQVESKIIQTPLEQRTSTWGLSLGFPISFAKQKSANVQTITERKVYRKTSYKRCVRL